MPVAGRVGEPHQPLDRHRTKLLYRLNASWGFLGTAFRRANSFWKPLGRYRALPEAFMRCFWRPLWRDALECFQRPLWMLSEAFGGIQKTALFLPSVSFFSFFFFCPWFLKSILEASSMLQDASEALGRSRGAQRLWFQTQVSSSSRGRKLSKSCPGLAMRCQSWPKLVTPLGLRKKGLVALLIQTRWVFDPVR